MYVFLCLLFVEGFVFQPYFLTYKCYMCREWVSSVPGITNTSCRRWLHMCLVFRVCSFTTVTVSFCCNISPSFTCLFFHNLMIHLRLSWSLLLKVKWVYLGSKNWPSMCLSYQNQNVLPCVSLCSVLYTHTVHVFLSWFHPLFFWNENDTLLYCFRASV